MTLISPTKNKNDIQEFYEINLTKWFKWKKKYTTSSKTLATQTVAQQQQATTVYREKYKENVPMVRHLL